MYTKGKWEVVDGAILAENINDYGNWIIASCERDRTEEDEANLRLIAAAPDLLEACKGVLNTITPSKLKGTIRENFSEQVALSQLAKAIAKAEIGQ